MEEKVCILPIGDIDEDVLLHTQEKLEEELNIEAVVKEAQKRPNYAYNKDRKQYYSTPILGKIYNLKLPECDRFLGIVDVDLYVPELTFVFGEADIKKRVAVISLTRLRQEFYNLPKDTILFKKRIITEAIHELGHTYRLFHCTDKNCVMFFSNTLDDTDRKGPDFCGICKKKIKPKRAF